MDGGGEEEEEGEMYGERIMETYITICKIDSQWEFTVCLDLWGGRWEGGSKGRGYMYTYG